RGGLAGARGTGHEHEAARAPGELVHRGWQPQLIDRAEPEGDQAERGPDRPALEVGVDAEARMAGNRVGEVELPVRLEALALVAGEDRVHDLARVSGAQLGVLLEPRETAANADDRARACRQVQVGCPA